MYFYKIQHCFQKLLNFFYEYKFINRNSTFDNMVDWIIYRSHI